MEPGNVYTFTVAVFYEKDPSLKNTAKVTVHVPKSALVASISGGSQSSAGASNAIKLDASDSFDPDESNVKPAFAWSCAMRDGSQCFDNKLNAPLELPSTDVVTLPELTLRSDTYVFSVVLTKDDRKATATQTLTVQLGSPPAISLFTPASIITKSSDLLVGSTVEVFNTGAYTYSWSILPAVNNLAAFCSSTTLESLLIKTGGESIFVEGTTYTVYLTVTDAAGVFATSAVKVQIAMPPVNGELDITPTEGVAFNTTFQLRTSKWVDTSTPLMCIFYAIDQFNGVEVMVPLNDASGDCELTLPAQAAGPAANNYTVQFGVKVTNQNNAFAMRYVSAVIRPGAPVTAAFATDLLDKIVSGASNTGSSDAVFGTIGSLLTGASQGSSDTSAIRSQALDAMTSFTNAADGMVLTTLNNVVDPRQASSSMVGKATAITASVMSNPLIGDQKSRTEQVAGVTSTLMEAARKNTASSTPTILSLPRRLERLQASAAATLKGVMDTVETNWDQSISNGVLRVNLDEQNSQGDSSSTMHWRLKQFDSNLLLSSNLACSFNDEKVPVVSSISFALCGLSAASTPSSVARLAAISNGSFAYTNTVSGRTLRGYVTYVNLVTSANEAIATASAASASHWSTSQTFVSGITNITKFYCYALNLVDYLTWSDTGINVTQTNLAGSGVKVTCSYPGKNKQMVGFFSAEVAPTAAPTAAPAPASGDDGVQSLKLSLKLTTSYDTMASGAGGLETFKTEVKKDVADALQISASRVTVTSVKKEGTRLLTGGILVDFSIASSSSASEKSLSTIQTLLTVQPAQITTIFGQGKWTASVDANAFVPPSMQYTCCDGKVKSAPCGYSCKAESSGSTTLYIIIGAAAGGVVLLVILYFAFCRKKGPAVKKELTDVENFCPHDGSPEVKNPAFADSRSFNYNVDKGVEMTPTGAPYASANLPASSLYIHAQQSPQIQTPSAYLPASSLYIHAQQSPKDEKPRWK